MSHFTPDLLRSTTEAEKWIGQFDGGDRAPAAHLLESLILVSHSDFQNGLFNLIRQARGHAKRPIPLFTMRESDKEEPLDDKETPIEHHHDVLNPWPDKEVLPVDTSYFAVDDKSIRPNAVGRAAGIGSEGTIASLIRDITNEDGNSAYQDHPSINSMTEVKSREVFLVDDIVGSGKRTLDFVDNFAGHKTIRSWLSGDHMSITIVAYAGTKSGIDIVKKHQYIKNVICARELIAGRRSWTEEERRRSIDLCHKYAYRSGRGKIPFGFRGAFTLLVFEHKCPNTTPPIFWSDSKKNHWRGLFRRRPGTGFPVWPIPINADELARQLLDRIGHPRLAASNWQLHVQPDGRFRLLILAAVAKRIKKPSILAEVVGLTQPVINKLLGECVASGWLTPDHRITTMGLKELAVARQLGLSDSEDVDLRPGFYYPKSLRAARESI